ncbi:MAG TPA: HAD-IB family phosphatase, partial [Acidimicrobiia bacterium]|nr:HAD-IB family phosphatase [Acidimicrobiia bacterium]
RVAVTGATGFLGTALVERLLRSVPECEVLPVVRPGRRAGAAERVRRDILRNDAFDRLRREWGDRFDAEIARRVTPLGGDVSVEGLGLSDADRERLAEVDVVIHSAAAVSFDSPLDAAVAVNLLGPSHVAAALRAVGSPAHLVAVSTAYVAGNRRGEAPEALLTETLFSTEVDWRAEVAGAERARADADAESRRPEMLKKFGRAARAELGAAGTPLLAGRAERLREQWVDDRLVQLGRARAAALGWPDAYAYTKALGERALAETRGDVPVSIVRPSIIESALAEPYPGWIRGFRMAEPVIISYARGLLKEFPGLPEGVVDVIPVDFVVAATLAVAAGAVPSEPVVYQAVTGTRNPLKYRTLVDLVQDWFSARPLYDDAGQPIVVPDWSFPGRGKVRRQLDRAVKGLAAAEKAAGHLPVRGARAEFAARLEERRTQAERALGYVELYGAYVETEARFDDRRLAALWETLPPVDQVAFCFDPRTIDWAAYVRDVHLPSIVHHARVRTKPGPKGGLSRRDRGRRAVLSPERTLAVFDLENTLVASNVVESYSWLASRRMDTGQRARFVARMLSEAPSLLALDRRDRGDFLRHFYRRYDGAPADRLRADAWELFSDLLLEKSFPEGLRRVREHRRLGHRTVLLTGALDFVIEPLRPLFDDVVSATLDERDGRLTGELIAVPPTGEARALLLAAYAEANDLVLSDAVAYADSASDLPMLESVGFPVAVNPEPKLATIARRRGWHVEHWSRAPGGPRPLLPMGARP